MKKVSVIIPCYNGENLIDTSLSSVFEQTYSNVEVIVVDDGSTDNSKSAIEKWIDKYAEKGYALKYVYQQNRGSGGAVDTGLKHITGEYLTLLDADDRFLSESIAKRAEFLDNNPDHVGVRSNGWYVRGKERRLFITQDEEKRTTDMFSALSFGKTNNWAGTYMIRTDSLFAAYPDRNIYPSRFGQNFQLLLPVSYKQKFGYIDEPLMEYIMQEDSLSQISDPEKQYSYGERNANGWRDIYLHVIDGFLTDEAERNYYINGYNSTYYRGRLSSAIAHHKDEAVKRYYKALKETGLITIDDMVSYYSFLRSFIVIPLKVYRRLKMIFKL